MIISSAGGEFNKKGPTSKERPLAFRYKFFSTICSLGGLIFMFSSYIAPYWVVIHGYNFKIHMGLWSICRDQACMAHIVLSSRMLITRIFMSIASAIGLLAATFAFLTSSSMRNSRWPLFTNCAAVTTLLSIVFFCMSATPDKLYGRPPINHRYPVTLGWTIYVGVIASFLFMMSANVHSTRTLLILALFCGFISTSFMTITYHYYSSFTAYRYMVAAMGSFFTGSLVFLAMSVYTIRVSTHANTKTAKITYQWSFYMAWSSCPFFILSGLFGLMAHSRSPIHRHLLNDSISSTMSYQSGSSSYLDSSTVLSD
ncbi:uncharacterized protein LOC128332547 isoform X2 [Hemicordylus capensis]|uniref:uncharacterized protein LOC128332547 isoform X2 n=1 Tax=Hemicordylus capensis TaxID=884348 RepID=UPI0023034141|nr:uncharacterized protein LOC128332547 isoform X2 [Hemicordylus capensis]